MQVHHNWINFLEEWGDKYKNGKFILSYLNSYPTILSKLRLTDIYNPDSIDSAQMEWIWLCSKFTNIIELEFFKPYWMPVQNNSFDYFMDISDNGYSIFEIHYFFYEPFRWYKEFITKDISNILLAPDTGFDLSKLRNEFDKQRWNDVSEFFRERKRLAYSGQLPIGKVNKDEIISENGSISRITIENAKNYIKLTGISSIVIGLLPFNLVVKVINIQHKYGNPYKSFNEVHNIRDLVFYLREHGMRGVESFQLEFENSKDGYVEFHENSIIVFHKNQNLLSNFRKQFGSV
jgi:hypothetical protein